MKKAINPTIKSLERWAYIVAIVGFPALLISIIVAIYQLNIAIKIGSSQNNIALNAMLFHSDTNLRLVEAIEKANADPKHEMHIRKKNGGEFSDTLIDIYIGDYDTVYQAYIEGFLNIDQLCSSFSYYLKAASKNTDIKEYLSENTSYFDGIRELPAIMKNSSDKNCR